MAQQKLYAGAKLRETRTRLNLTQRAFAERLGVSLPYLNQMENNNRPVSTGVILALVQEFGFDVAELSNGESDRMVADMREALADPLFANETPALADLKLAASNAPALIRSFLQLHSAYRQSTERLVSLENTFGGSTPSSRMTPWEDVRDFFHYRDNYIDTIDRAAEDFATKPSSDLSIEQRASQALEQMGVRLRYSGTDTRRYDPQSAQLFLSVQLPRTTQTFQILHQIALLKHADLLDDTLDNARFHSPEARKIARIGLANYFAGAALMPYEKFLTSAQDTRHDLERLAGFFEASIEQIAHRLSTLQRSGAKGIPFFFVRVDQAGTITKRHSSTQLQFARYGGACPLWNVHQAFETPGRFLRQLAETPDGVQYLSIARDVTKSGGAFNAPVRRYAIGLGCEIKHASQLVYADDMELNNAHAFEPIGISCRICERANCHQRSVPPLEQKLRITPNQRGVLPYSIESLD